MMKKQIESAQTHLLPTPTDLPSSMPLLVGEHILISDGLEGQDDNFETVMTLWEDLQLSSFEVAAQQPSMDFISFAQTAFFFGVITRAPASESKEAAEQQLPLEDWAESDSSARQVQPALRPKDYRLPKSTPVDPWLAPLPVTDAPRPSAIDDAMLEDLALDWASTDSQTVLDAPGEESDIAAQENIDSELDFILSELDSRVNDFEKRNIDLEKRKAARERRRESSENIESWGSLIWSAIGGASTSRVDTSKTPRPAGARDYTASFYDTDKRSSTSSNPLLTQKTVVDTNSAIGIIYLAVSPLSHSPQDQVGELNLGIILNKAHRGKGYAREAIQLALKHAFDVKHCHRIQASLLSLSTKDRMVSLLTQLRFGHEGTKRRSFFNPLMGEWQDVTTLAILDTDWAMRSYYKPAPKSLWDELFLRHERERDELLRWEEDNNRLKRTASMVTIRGAAPPSEAASNIDSEAESVASSVSTSASKGKKRMAPSGGLRDPYDGSSSDAESDFGDGGFVRRFVFDDERVGGGPSSPALSSTSLVESVPGSVSSLRSPSVSGSDWDMMESSSSHSFSDDEGSRG
ncbi:hypothetical protein C8F04DRAFT_1084706 [Mycena alexandri]|uniref:N-acetyltransferase domain-containing protein n=1 Tax=Mycena alexandri TaxID=1745969 RepID=A0AAD6X8X6_9AGAR|nr:hypothetical protein C8F04DRAFT_1084706 [Mycena alexandri]